MRKGNVKNLVILKKHFWIIFFKSFGCLGLLLFAGLITSFDERDANTFVFMFLYSSFFFLGFYSCYQELTDKIN